MKKSWAADILAGLFLAGLLLAGTAACSRDRDSEPLPGGAEDAAVLLAESWMSRYAGKDARVARLLTDQGEAWLNFREMDLTNAVDAFDRFGGAGSRIGKARAYLELAETSDALDRLLLDIEGTYLGAAGEKAIGESRGRRAFALLRGGDLPGAEGEFGKEPPPGQEARWKVGRGVISLIQGDAAGGEALVAVQTSGDRDAAVMALIEAYQHGRSIPHHGKREAFGDAVISLQKGDPTGALKALGRLDAAGLLRVSAGPDLYLYALYREAYSRMALAVLKGMETAEAKWLSGRAYWGVGDYDAAAAAFAVAEGGGVAEEAFWLFGKPIGSAELAEIARVWKGAALIKSGKHDEGMAVWRTLVPEKLGSLACGDLAMLQQEMGLTEPLATPLDKVRSSLEDSQMLRIKALGMDNGEIYSALLAARHAAIARDTAAVASKLGKKRASLDHLDGAHQKHRGYRPDFANPPAFLVDLAKAYVDVGEYAPAVEILFELSEKMPATRFAYESLKRLYASRIGGAAPPL